MVGLRWLPLAAAGLVVALALAPIRAASSPVVGHPILGSGPDSTFAFQAEWAGSGISRVNSASFSFSGENVTGVVVHLTVFTPPRRCWVQATVFVTLLGAGGGTLASGTLSVTMLLSGNVSVPVSPSVYYHRIATVRVYAEGWTDCWGPPDPREPPGPL
jgi:hypothetical protein